jgi:hypothetical protein
MKFTVPGLALAALIVASPVAFAQNMNTGNASTPGASVAKDDTNPTKMTKHSKKHTASYKHKHHAKATTGSGNTSVPGAGINKDDTTPKSK